MKGRRISISEQKNKNKILNKMKIFMKFHSQLISTLNQNFNVLNNFLTEFDCSQDNAVEDFIIKYGSDISDSWIFNKINFKNLNINKVKNDITFPNLLLKCLSLDNKNKYKIIYVDKPNSHSNLYYDYYQLVKENSEILENLTFNTITTGDFNNFCLNIKHILLKNLKKIKVVNSNLSSSDSKLDFLTLTTFPSTNEIKFVNNQMNLRLMDENFYRNGINLKKLIFNKCGLIKQDVAQIFNIMKECLNLEIINLSNNHITQFNLEQYQDRNNPIIFNELLSLNLGQNNLYSIKIKNYLPELKLLNISNNNICLIHEIEEYRNIIFSEKSCLILANNNQCMMNNPDFTIKYLRYLSEKFSNMDYCMKNLDLSFLTIFENRNSYNSNFFETLMINKDIQFSILNLNLSFSNIYQITLNNLFLNNNRLINLKKVCLRRNNLNDDFFECLINNEIYKTLLNLEEIDLTENLIKNTSSLDKIKQIFQDNNKIKKIKLNFNEIEFNLNELILNYENKNLKDDDVLLVNRFIQCLRLQISNKKILTIFISRVYYKNLIGFVENKQLDKNIVFE